MAPAMKPRTVCFCQPIFSMISVMVAPFLRCSMLITWAILLPVRGSLASRFFPPLLALRAALAGVAFLGTFLRTGAPLGATALAVAFVVAFAFPSATGVFAWGLIVFPNFCTRSQILAAAS